MNSVLFSSQIANNRLVLDLFREAWRGAGVEVCPLAFPLGEPGPLSWHLSQEDRRALLQAWQNEEHDRRARQAKEFLAGGPCPEAADRDAPVQVARQGR